MPSNTTKESWEIGITDSKKSLHVDTHVSLTWWLSKFINKRFKNEFQNKTKNFVHLRPSLSAQYMGYTMDP